ncbi:uncharacterized protein LOC131303019 [Rhododendron vialii]|uniref:uncharacterized protein LOC131303019 n=1 Tax=Rhododendron vialii TaxID=182163 RepID=UPI00265F74AA|nr:uncharacterized protein LOC131303019 [Rhododendron vialii]
MLFEELVGKLQTFELNHLSKKPISKASKSIAFKTSNEKFYVSQDSDDQLDEEELAFFAKKFKKFVKFRKDNKQGNSSASNDGPKMNNSGFGDKKFSTDKSKQPQGIQCYEYHGFGHVQVECPDTLKKKSNRGYKVTWDDDSEEASNSQNSHNKTDEVPRYTVLVASVTSPTSPEAFVSTPTCSIEDNYESSDEDVNNDEDDLESIHDAYNELFKECVKLKKKKKELILVIKKVEIERNSLRVDVDSRIHEIEELKAHQTNFNEKFAKIEKECLVALKALGISKERVKVLEHDLKEASEAIKRNNCGASRIVELTHTFKNRSGLGFIYPPSVAAKISEKPNKEIKFVKSVSSTIPKTLDCPIPKKWIITCHHCGTLGHVRPYCYKFLNNNKNGNGRFQIPNVYYGPKHSVPNFRKPRKISQPKSEKHNENFEKQLSHLANQTSHIVEEIQKLSSFAKGLNERNTSPSQNSFNHLSQMHNKPKQVWKKVDIVCNVAHTAFKADYSHAWYLDSGCSRHMIGNKSWFSKLEKYNGGFVTFGDGNIGRRHHIYSRSSTFGKCLIFKGVRSSDNCYCVQMDNLVVCNRIMLDDVELWHQRLWHEKSLMLLLVLNRFAFVFKMKRDILSYVLEVIMVENLRTLKLTKYCDDKGIKHEFLAPRTPQQNGVVDRRNRTLQEMARVMLHAKRVPRDLWVEAINTACYTINRVYVRPETTCTPYEIWNGKKPSVKYFRVFGSKCHILRDSESLGKFDSRSDDGGEPSEKEKAVETESNASESSYDEELGQHDLIPSNAKEPSARVKLNHPKDLVVGNLDEGMLTRRKATNIANYVCYTSSLEPKKVEEALSDELWIGAM